MRTFNDRAGRVWTVDLTIGCLRSIRASLGVDLTKPEEPCDALGRPAADNPPLSQRITQDVMLCVDVLFAAVEEQAAGQQVDAVQFARDLPATHFRTARLVLLEEWLEFFQQLERPDQAAVVRTAIDLDNELQQQKQKSMAKLQAAAVESLRKEVAKATDEAIAELTAGEKSTSSPALSESTPNP